MNNDKYQIVKFLGELSADQKPVVDLVPRGWVKVNDHKACCAYPPYPYLNLRNMVKNMFAPGLTWTEYPVTILGSGTTYAGALVKLDRAVRKLNVSKTDDERKGAVSLRPEGINLDCAPSFPLGTEQDANSSGNGAKRNLIESLGSSSDTGEFELSSGESENLSLETLRARQKPRKRSQGLDIKRSSSTNNKNKGEIKKKRKTSVFSQPCISDSDSSSGKNKGEGKKKRKTSTVHSKPCTSDDDGLEDTENSRVKTSSKNQAPPTALSPFKGLSSPSGIDYNFLNGSEDSQSPLKTSVLQRAQNKVPEELQNPTKKSSLPSLVPPNPEGTFPATFDKTSSIETASNLFRRDGAATQINKDREGIALLLQKIAEIEERIDEKIQRMKRSLSHDIRKNKRAIDSLAGLVNGFVKLHNSGGSLALGTVADFEKEHCDSDDGGKKLPFTALQDFKEFDAKLSGKTYDEFVKVLLSLWVKIGESHTMTRSIGLVMERYLTKEVALQFSAQGKGKLKKLNFSALNFYKALEDAVMSAEGCDSKTVIKATSKVLAQACDREGGRQEREEEKKKREKEDEEVSKDEDINNV